MNNLTNETKAAISDALATGNKILAVKIYKDATGCDLKTAKAAIESNVLGENSAGESSFFGELPGVDDAVAGLILDAIFEGRKLDAVKHYKFYSGRGLKESKEFIEDLTKRLKTESPDQFTTDGGCVSSILLMAMMLVVATIGFLVCR